MKKYGKKYTALLEKLGDRQTPRAIEDAVAAVLETGITKFDSTAEIHVKTSCDPRYADQIVRSTVILPNGTGKTLKIAVFCEGEDAKEAQEAGADLVGGDKLIDEVMKGNIDFDIAVATPDMMKPLAKAARVLGPKGLMPSPKAGTVTQNISKTVEELKKGKIEFRTDKNGIVHSVFGKLSFGKSKLEENVKTLVKAIVDAKPAGVKGAYILGISVSSTMGPGIAVDTSSIGK